MIEQSCHPKDYMILTGTCGYKNQ